MTHSRTDYKMYIVKTENKKTMHSILFQAMYIAFKKRTLIEYTVCKTSRIR